MASLREPGESRQRSPRSNGKHDPDRELAHRVMSMDSGTLDAVIARLKAQRYNGAGQAVQRLHDPFTPQRDLHPHRKMIAGGQIAMDEATFNVFDVNSMTPALAWAASGLSALSAEGLMFLGYPLLSEMAQRPEYRTMIDIIATEATSKWIALRSKSNNDDQTDKISELKDYLDDLELCDRFRKCSDLDSNFGRAHLYINTGQGDNPEELLTPIGNGRDKLSAAKVTKGSKLSFKAIEPIWCSPQDYNTTDPLSEDWYRPSTWITVSKRIHASRLLTFVSREVPDILKPAYSFGGLALIQMAKPYVDNWIRTRQSVSDLVHSFAVFVLETDLSTILQPGGGDDLFKRIDLFNLLRDNRGLMAVNKDSEGFQNVVTPLGTLDALQAQSQEQMCSVSRIPVVKFTGIQPAGLNADSEGVIRTFYDTIHAYQARFFTPQLKRCVAFAMLALWGEVDDDIVFDYEPLFTLTPKEAAEQRKIDAETGKLHIEAGVISEEEERRRVATDPKTVYQGLDIEDVPEPPEDPGMEGAPGPQDDGGDEPEGRAAAEDAVIPFDDDDAPFDDPDDPDRIVADAALAADETDAHGHEHAPPGSPSGGQFVAQGGGGGAGGGSGEAPPSEFKSKKEHVAHLLKSPEGVTGKAILKATGWKAISMPAMALSLGVNLIKMKNKWGETAYKSGEPLTKEQIAELKKPKKEAAAPAPASTPAPAPASQPASAAAAAPAAPKLDVSKITPQMMQKAAKGTYIPPDQLKFATKEKNAFNDKWGGKTLTDPQEIAQKIIEYQALIEANKKGEQQQAAATKAEQEATQKKIQEELAAAKAKAAEKNKAIMEEFGITDAEATGFQALVEMMAGGEGMSKANLVEQFHHYEKQAKALNLPISGFEYAMIRSYINGAYHKVNPQLRAGTLTPQQHMYARLMNASLDKLPKFTGTVKRGTNLNAEQIAAYVPGHVIEERAFTSTGDGFKFSGNVSYTIKAIGKRGADFSTTANTSEKEVLFKAHTFFLVHKVEKKNNVTHIHMEEVEHHG